MGDATDIVRNGIPGVPRQSAFGIVMRGSRMITVDTATGEPVVLRDLQADPGLGVMLDEAKRRHAAAEHAVYRHAQTAGVDGDRLVYRAAISTTDLAAIPDSAERAVSEAMRSAFRTLATHLVTHAGTVGFEAAFAATFGGFGTPLSAAQHNRVRLPRARVRIAQRRRVAARDGRF